MVVAGTHGKTTTSALVAGLLDAAGLAPGYLIGGVPRGLERSFRAPPRARNLLRGTPPPFVIEGDEYDTAFFEKTAKFLHYSAEVVVLTSIEHDHIDIYPTLEGYLWPFRELIARLPAQGLIVANAADEHVVRLVREHATVPVYWYALEGQETFGAAPHWLVAPSAADATGTSFDLFLGGVSAGRWVTPLMGRHNLANAAAALAATVHGFGVEPSSLRNALAGLRGVARRQDLLGRRAVCSFTTILRIIRRRCAKPCSRCAPGTRRGGCLPCSSRAAPPPPGIFTSRCIRKVLVPPTRCCWRAWRETYRWMSASTSQRSRRT